MYTSIKTLMASAVMVIGGLWVAAYAAEPYVVGLSGDLSGPAAPTYKPLSEGARVYIAQVNAKGGINGHPIKLLIRDSQSNPTKAVGDLYYFDNKKAVAVFFASPSGTLGAYVQKNKSLKIPTIYINACYPPATPPSPSPNFFCPPISTLADSYAAVDMMKKLMGDQEINLGFVTTDIPGAKGAVTALMAPYAKKMGMRVEKDNIAVLPLGTTDASDTARNFKNRGVNAVISYTISKHMVAGAEALSQIGWKGKYLLTTSLPGTINAIKQLKDPNIYGWDHMTLLSANKPIDTKIENAVKKFGFDFPAEDVRWGYRDGMVLGAALRKCGWPCDRASLRKTLNHFTDDSKAMVSLNLNPVKFTPTNHTSPAKKYQIYHWSSDKHRLVPVLKQEFTEQERDWK